MFQSLTQYFVVVRAALKFRILTIQNIQERTQNFVFQFDDEFSLSEINVKVNFASNLYVSLGLSGPAKRQGDCFLDLNQSHKLMRVKGFNAGSKQHFHCKTITGHLKKLKSKPFSRVLRNPLDFLLDFFTWILQHNVHSRQNVNTCV